MQMYRLEQSDVSFDVPWVVKQHGLTWRQVRPDMKTIMAWREDDHGLMYMRSRPDVYADTLVSTGAEEQNHGLPGEEKERNHGLLGKEEIKIISFASTREYPSR